MISAPNRGFDRKSLFSVDKDAAATRAAIRWLRDDREEPFFVWLHLMGPHDPYDPAPRFAKRFDTGYRGALNGRRRTLKQLSRRTPAISPAELEHIVSLYDGDIAEVDERISTVLATLAQLGLAGDTLVVLTSDHGEELYEHNRYFFHSNSIYESVLRVPLILRLPGVLPAGKRLAAPVQSIDIAPTALELLGLPIPGEFEGRSLMPRIRPEYTEHPEAAAISELGPEIFSLRTARWHYIYNPLGYTSPATRPDDRGDEGLFRIARHELYDIVADPKESINLVEEHPDVAAELRGRLRAWIQEEVSAYEPPELTPEVREELEALGYLD
jgi:arylsulfatase A-like enzyme